MSIDFDDFLPDGPIHFPSALVEVEINNLRKIDASQLEASLESLVESDLPDLRRLSLKTILKISDYRVRARIRNQWRDKLEQVFLRRSAPPVSFRSRTKYPSVGMDVANDSSATSTSDESKKRQSSRISRSSRPADRNTPSEDITMKDALVRRQGLCDLVEFRVDDQRPAESQYAEADFLDDEMSGDEDYRD